MQGILMCPPHPKENRKTLRYFLHDCCQMLAVLFLPLVPQKPSLIYICYHENTWMVHKILINVMCVTTVGPIGEPLPQQTLVLLHWGDSYQMIVGWNGKVSFVEETFWCVGDNLTHLNANMGVNPVSSLWLCVTLKMSKMLKEFVSWEGIRQRCASVSGNFGWNQTGLLDLVVTSLWLNVGIPYTCVQ